ncbi:MAG TPA: copper resistance protein CopC [Candidatus Limnocylindria bacterium]|nr:copper resistance protein CopC [Candidatus Limnocylindria bacterium]
MASSPGAGSTLEEAPDEIRLIFSEPIEDGLSSLDVVRQDGAFIVDHGGTVDPNDPHALVLPDPGLGDGVYSVTWRSLSAADGHTEQGFFTFGIGTDEILPQVSGGGEHGETDPIGVIGRWLTYVGLLLGVGIPLFHRAVLRAAAMPIPLVRLLAALLAISSAATLVMAVASAIEAGSIGGYLFGSRNGLLQVARAAVADAGAVLLLVAPRRLTGAVAAISGLAGIALLILAGHAAALPDPVPVVVGIVHVVAVAVWFGGLVGLVLVVFRPALILDGPPPRMREIVPRFSALGLAAIGMVAITGAYEVWAETGQLLPIGTDYGRTLLMKTALALGAFSIGALNYFDGGRMRPWLDGFPTRVAVESMTAAAVLVLAAALATTPPVEEGVGVEIAPVPDAFGNVAQDMSMEIVPGRPGVNRVVVTANDALVALDLRLTLDQLDAGTSSTFPLVPRGLEGMEGMEGMEHGSMVTPNDDGTIDWTADAVVLPAGSSWNGTVETTSADGSELGRQRYTFALDDEGISEGEVTTLVNPATVIALILLAGGALGLGLGIGGFALPRCETDASRLALLGGGTTAMVLGALMAIQVIVGAVRG